MSAAFSFPARYTKVVESALALALAEIGRDVKYRERTGDVTDTWHPIADELLENGATGRIVVALLPESAAESLTAT